MTKVVSVNVSMPRALKAYVDERSETGGYTCVSEYIRELIRLDQRAAKRPSRSSKQFRKEADAAECAQAVKAAREESYRRWFNEAVHTTELNYRQDEDDEEDEDDESAPFTN